MKKIIALLLIAVMCFALVACGDKENKNENSDVNNTENAEDSTTEKQYKAIEQFLKDPYDVRDYESNSYIHGDEALLFVYNWLNNHTDYKDCAKYLSRFVVIYDALTKITKNTTDAFGQVTESNYEAYNYDVNGECFEFSELYNTLVFVNVVGAGKYQIKDCKYDDNGKIVSIDLRSNMAGDERTILKIAIEYDTNGNITKADFIQHDGKTWSNTYTYDDQGRVVTAILNGIYAYSGWYGTDYSERYEYQYDADGNLIKRTNKFSLGEEYTYSEDGKLLVVDYLERDKGDPFVTKRETYSYDENGRISAIEVIESKSGYGSIESSDAVKYTLLYHYEDVIIYDKNR